MSKILNKLNQFLHIIIPYSIVGVIVFLFILYIWAPELFYNSLPELIGTFIGAVLGFELGSIAERKSREEAEKLRIETEKEQNIGESVNLLTMMLEENEENLKQPWGVAHFCPAFSISNAFSSIPAAASSLSAISSRPRLFSSSAKTSALRR